MSRIIAHTMATPELRPVGALDLAAELELGGIELVCQDGYPCGIAPDCSFRETSALAREAAARGVVVAGLAPYAKGLNSAAVDERRAAVVELEGVIARAEDLGCAGVRVLAGTQPAEAGWEPALRRLVESLGELAERAAAHGVDLRVENHMDTMALSASRTMEIIHAVDRRNVGVLYDQANLVIMGAESADEALALQAAAIRHVHVKDFRPAGADREPVLPGEGSLRWPEIVTALARYGYQGYYSLEYEKRWYPDLLPAAGVGLRAWRDHVQGVLDDSEMETV